MYPSKKLPPLSTSLRHAQLQPVLYYLHPKSRYVAFAFILQIVLFMSDRLLSEMTERLMFSFSSS